MLLIPSSRKDDALWGTCWNNEAQTLSRLGCFGHQGAIFIHKTRTQGEWTSKGPKAACGKKRDKACRTVHPSKTSPQPNVREKVRAKVQPPPHKDFPSSESAAPASCGACPTTHHEMYLIEIFSSNHPQVFPFDGGHRKLMRSMHSSSLCTRHPKIGIKT